MQVRDDRGKRVQLLPNLQLQSSGVVQSPLPVEVRRELQSELKLIDSSIPVQLACAAVFAAIVGWIALWILVGVRMFGQVRPNNSVTTVLWTVSLFIPAFPARWFIIKAGARRRAHAIASRGFCPSCGYAMAGLHVEPDGCTVCPECGSAWRLNERKNARPCTAPTTAAGVSRSSPRTNSAAG